MSRSTMQPPAPSRKAKPFQVIVVTVIIIILIGSGLVSAIGAF